MMLRTLVLAAVLCAAPLAAHAASSKTVDIGGRTLKCEIPRYDNQLAVIHTTTSHSVTGGGEAASGDTQIWLNTPMMNKLKPVVQWFIFQHECGHLQISGGGTELQADLFAIKTGIREGWLVTDDDYQRVCDSWEGAPAVGEHPSAKTRCAQVKKYMDKAEVERKQQLEEIARKNVEEAARIEAAKPFWYRWLGW